METALEFRITTAQIGRESYVIAIGGEVDMYTAQQLERDLAAVAARGGKTVVVDFSAVSFIDSTVLGVLVRELKRLGPAGGELLIVSDDPRILRAFEITGLDRMFRIERNLSGAIAVGDDG